jgi:hypothetical protein
MVLVCNILKKSQFRRFFLKEKSVLSIAANTLIYPIKQKINGIQNQYLNLIYFQLSLGQSTPGTFYKTCLNNSCLLRH